MAVPVKDCVYFWRMISVSLLFANNRLQNKRPAVAPLASLKTIWYIIDTPVD